MNQKEYQIKADDLSNSTEETSAVSSISYQIENANLNSLNINRIKKQVNQLKFDRSFPKNLEYVDSYTDSITGTTSTAFLNKDTGKVIVGMTGTNVHMEQLKSTLNPFNFDMDKQDARDALATIQDLGADANIGLHTVTDKFSNALKMTQNFDDKELKSIRQVMGKATPKSVLKSSSKAAFNEVISENMRDLVKNPKKIKDFTLKELEDFKGKNLLGKGLKSLKILGKGLGPLSAIAAVGLNFGSKKSTQKKVVDSAVDLSAIAASTGTGTAIGASIGGPLGAGAGLLIGAGIGLATEAKVFKGGKSVTDIAKDKANQTVNATKGSFIDFGKTLGNIF
ncbi:hypothetical protein ACWEYO_14120 [Staphylococcus shinii]|uniref:hypothetical protein n=1 Tax=Staphylococcus TaxID=1279 RepID=UPI00115D2348|nr:MULTISPECIES: hypothetical protein [Staphylococcus]